MKRNVPTRTEREKKKGNRDFKKKKSLAVPTGVFRPELPSDAAV